MNYVKVYVEHSALSLNQLFTYSCDEPVQPGCRVVVPFGPRELTAIVAALAKEPETSRKILPVSQVLDKTPLLNDELFELSGWLSDRCCASVISVLKTMLPPAMRPKTGHSKVVMEQWLEQGIPADGAKLTGKQESFLSGLQLPVPAAQARRISASMTRSLLEKGFLKSVDRPKDRDLITLPAKDVPPELRPGQMQALEQIRQSKASVFLLHGVTGSGKTEVFLRLAQEALEQPPELRPGQMQALEQIRQSKASVFLLHGVTGSGKTEVFLRLAQEALEQGRQVLFLVPEIGLTPMMTQRVMARFQDQIAVYHSYLSPQEKYTQYQRVKEGKARIVVGTRSACFMPFDNLGLILMDEEHDASYMQDSMPRYHTRDVVLHRAAHHGCKVVMASATPSLESYARTLKHVYELVQLPERVNFRMPEIRLLDMSKETVRDGFSQTLLDAIQSRLERKEQVILLLNRRGYLPVVRCADCHDVRICPDCGIALSYHKKENRLVCHSCDRSFRYDPVCPACGSTHTAPVGMGTEKLEDTLQTLFPDARILRMDADSTRKKGAHKALLDRFSHGADILVGTQMVAKGLDFPNVTLVGILQADNALIRSDYRAAELDRFSHGADILVGTQMVAKGLDFPNVTLVGILQADNALIRSDYRAAESAYEMLEQASGRSGRGEKPGEVMIQTFDPSHYVLQSVRSHGYQSFFRREMQYRHLGDYPPYIYMAMLVFSHSKPETVMERAQSVRSHGYQSFFRREMQYRHLGDYPPYIYMAMLVFSHSKPETVMERARQAVSHCRDQRILGPVTISMRQQKHRVRLVIKDRDDDRLLHTCCIPYGTSCMRWDMDRSSWK